MNGELQHARQHGLPACNGFGNCCAAIGFYIDVNAQRRAAAHVGHHVAHYKQFGVVALGFNGVLGRPIGPFGGLKAGHVGAGNGLNEAKAAYAGELGMDVAKLPKRIEVRACHHGAGVVKPHHAVERVYRFGQVVFYVLHQAVDLH